jgi:hypothetical protein
LDRRTLLFVCPSLLEPSSDYMPKRMTHSTHSKEMGSIAIAIAPLGRADRLGARRNVSGWDLCSLSDHRVAGLGGDDCLLGSGDTGFV